MSRDILYLKKESDSEFTIPFNHNCYDKSKIIDEIFSDEKITSNFLKFPEKFNIGNGNTETTYNINNHRLYSNLNYLYNSDLLSLIKNKNIDGILNFIDEKNLISYSSENDPDSKASLVNVNAAINVNYAIGVNVVAVVSAAVAAAAAVAVAAVVVVYPHKESSLKLYKTYLSPKINNELAKILNIIEIHSNKDFALKIDLEIIKNFALKLKNKEENILCDISI